MSAEDDTGLADILGIEQTKLNQVEQEIKQEVKRYQKLEQNLNSKYSEFKAEKKVEFQIREKVKSLLDDKKQPSQDDLAIYTNLEVEIDKYRVEASKSKERHDKNLAVLEQKKKKVQADITTARRRRFQQFQSKEQKKGGAAGKGTPGKPPLSEVGKGKLQSSSDSPKGAEGGSDPQKVTAIVDVHGPHKSDVDEDSEGKSEEKGKVDLEESLQELEERLKLENKQQRASLIIGFLDDKLDIIHEQLKDISFQLGCIALSNYQRDVFLHKKQKFLVWQIILESRLKLFRRIENDPTVPEILEPIGDRGYSLPKELVDPVHDRYLVLDNCVVKEEPRIHGPKRKPSVSDTIPKTVEQSDQTIPHKLDTSANLAPSLPDNPHSVSSDSDIEEDTMAHRWTSGSRDIWKFQGLPNEMADSHLLKLRDFMQGYGISEDISESDRTSDDCCKDIIDIFVYSLVGPARTWYEINIVPTKADNGYDTWKSIKKKFLDQYNPAGCTIEQQMNAIRHTTWDQIEPIDQYAYRFEQMFKSIFGTDHDDELFKSSLPQYYKDRCYDVRKKEDIIKRVKEIQQNLGYGPPFQSQPMHMTNPHMAGGNVPNPQHQNRYPQSGYPTGNYQYPGYPHANYQGYPGAVQNTAMGYSGQNPDPNMVQHGQGYNVGNYPYNPQQPQRAQSPHGQANVPYGQSPKQGPSQGQQYPPFPPGHQGQQQGYQPGTPQKMGFMAGKSVHFADRPKSPDLESVMDKLKGVVGDAIADGLQEKEKRFQEDWSKMKDDLQKSMSYTLARERDRGRQRDRDYWKRNDRSPSRSPSGDRYRSLSRSPTRRYDDRRYDERRYDDRRNDDRYRRRDRTPSRERQPQRPRNGSGIRYNPNIICNDCGQKGHIARYCTNRDNNNAGGRAMLMTEEALSQLVAKMKIDQSN